VPIVIHDPETLAAFLAARGPAEVRGPQSQLLGHFTPISKAANLTAEDLDREAAPIVVTDQRRDNDARPS
jgi:hypothetical protein